MFTNYKINRHGTEAEAFNEFHFMDSIEGVKLFIQLSNGTEFSGFLGDFLGEKMKTFFNSYSSENYEVVKVQFFFANVRYILTDIDDFSISDFLNECEYALSGITGIEEYFK